MERQKATIMRINEMSGKIALLSDRIQYMTAKIREAVKR